MTLVALQISQGGLDLSLDPLGRKQTVFRKPRRNAWHTFENNVLVRISSFLSLPFHKSTVTHKASSTQNAS
jgi:hypothetical protein